MTAQERWSEAWRHRERLLRIARRRVPTLEDAEDVVAEAIQRAGTQDGLAVDAVPAWITRVTINLCIDRQRRLATQRALLQHGGLRPDVLPSHEDEVVSRAEARWVAGEVDALPARQAQALRLRAQGLDNPEVAARLGVTVATVEGLVKRSRAALRLALRAAGAALVGGWAVTWRGRRAPALIAVSSMLMLVLMPWSAGPPPAALPDPGRAPVLTAPVGTTPVGTISAGPAATPEQVLGQNTSVVHAPAVSPGRNVDPLIGTSLPYEGPRCVAVYCLPIVDEEVDRRLGATSPQGWSPADLQDYLGEPRWSQQAAARRPLVVVLGWYSFPWIARDLAVYRSTFHLPPCGEEDGCLQIVVGPETGSVEDLAEAPAQRAAYAAIARNAGSNYNGNPPAEQAQMLQSISATCPECRLALVVGSSHYGPNMVEAIKLAKAMQPDVIVTKLDVIPSFEESNEELADPRLYDGPLFAAGGGVAGYDPRIGTVPRRFPHVVTVGGTLVDGGRVTADLDNASFCNSTVDRPPWQRTMETGCPGRAGMDVVLPAGGDTALSVYISGGLSDDRGWYHPGHVSQALGIFGGLFARHNLASVVEGPGDLYAHPEWFADIVDGTTECLQEGCRRVGASPPERPGCRPGSPQLCTAGRGWDGATGLGEARHLPWIEGE